jgi:AcrR family transcriptional regulator
VKRHHRILVIRETTAPLRQTRRAMKRTLAQREDRASYSAEREKIVKAAGPVLKRYGLSGTTIEAIAQEADVDRATGPAGDTA